GAVARHAAKSRHLLRLSPPAQGDLARRAADRARPARHPDHEGLRAPPGRRRRRLHHQLALAVAHRGSVYERAGLAPRPAAPAPAAGGTAPAGGGGGPRRDLGRAVLPLDGGAQGRRARRSPRILTMHAALWLLARLWIVGWLRRLGRLLR